MTSVLCQIVSCSKSSNVYGHTANIPQLISFNSMKPIELHHCIQLFEYFVFVECMLTAMLCDTTTELMMPFADCHIIYNYQIGS